MIKTERQARTSEQRHRELTESAEFASEGDRGVFEDLAGEVAAELAEYREIRAGIRTRFQLDEIDRIGEALVKARLARQWTQRQLAEAVGVSEQMVQRDEAGGYERASLTRLAEIADVLGYELDGVIRPKSKVGDVRELSDSTATLRVVRWASEMSPGVARAHRATHP